MSLNAVRPKILGFISEDVSAWLVALVVLLVGGILTALLAWSTLNLFHQQLRQRFQLLASERYSRIEERFEDQEQRLDGVRRFFANSNSVSRHEFDGYTKPLLHRTQAYSFARRVSHAERPEFERQVREEGLPDFTIRELMPNGQLQLAAERDEYLCEAADVAIALGARDADLPRTWSALEAYLARECASGRIAVGTDARMVVDVVLFPPLSAISGPFAWVNRVVTLGLLPPFVREEYHYVWTPGREVQFKRVTGAIRGLRRVTPNALALWPKARTNKLS
jgi:uncharacterized protein (DUF2236 family)